MDYFIVKEDIYQTYPEEQLNKLTNSVDAVWQKEIPRAIEEVSGFLRARYDEDLIFADVLIWDNLTAYSADDRLYDDINKMHYLCILDAPAATLLTNTTYYTEGDTRNQKIVEIIVDVMLYKILSRLNAIDMPLNRKERYDGNDAKQLGGALGWLKMVARGTVHPDLPLIVANQDDQTGNVVIYGDATDVKTQNFVF